MDPEQLFAEAPSSTMWWSMGEFAILHGRRRLGITSDVARGGKLSCLRPGRAWSKACNSWRKKWRHLDFLQYMAYTYS